VPWKISGDPEQNKKLALLVLLLDLMGIVFGRAFIFQGFAESNQLAARFSISFTA
jgi:hypothetical protein